MPAPNVIIAGTSLKDRAIKKIRGKSVLAAGVVKKKLNDIHAMNAAETIKETTIQGSFLWAKAPAQP